MIPGQTDAAAVAGRFTFPAPDRISYATAGTVRITWDPGSSGVTKWRLQQVLARADVNGACLQITFTKGVTLHPTGRSVAVPNHRVGFCYRYKLWPANAASGSQPAFISGRLRVITSWTGTVDLYRKGVFSSQATIRWCVAASIQMMLNIIRDQQDHTYDNQLRYIQYARLHDGYPPGSAAKGTDAQGWVVALNHFGGSTSYHWVASQRFKWALRSAVRQLRRTGKPVGLVVAHSTHAWVMTGFDATADPATTSAFRVEHVYVMGPLYPRQPHNGYDPPPDKRLSVTQLRNFLNRYYDTRRPKNPWQGSFVTIQP